MKKVFLLVMGGMLSATSAHAENLPEMYKKFKDDLNKQTGITYDGMVTSLAQRGSPNGKITPIQMQYYAEANWDMYKSDKIGEGSMQISYTKIRYQGREEIELNENLGLASDANDYSVNTRYFNQLTYTHKLPGQMDWLSASFGQFPMWLFDGNPYLSNQQTDFNNLLLSQNGSYTYPSASMGGFITAAPTEEWTFVAGFQDANNLPGAEIKFSSFNDGDYMTFGSVAYTPKDVKGWGKGHYAFLLYNQPRVDARDVESNGWSLNVSQDFGEKWALFGRANGNDGGIAIKQSYALGTAYKDPLKRNNDLDRIGVAVGVNKVNKNVADEESRSMETVVEAYWNVGISDYILITPDIQYYYKPALNPEHNDAFVYSLRATLMF